jgi:2-polyprenyl-3-methyl-5-hydroxy-6-metoxy-1,4-benzoquinol methylase
MSFENTSEKMRKLNLDRRKAWVATARSEQFNVPLECNLIEQAIQDAATREHGPKRVLDVGCGRQPFRRTLESAGYQYLSTDVEQNCDGTTDFIFPVDSEMPDALLDHHMPPLL